MLYFAREAIIPVRSEPSEAAEMDTQLVFGDICEVMERQGNWWKIKGTEDHYEGWVNPAMLLKIPDENHPQLQSWRYILNGNLIMDDGSEMRMPLGARIPISEESSSGFRINHVSFLLSSDLQFIPASSREDIIPTARLFLNTPYVWGGKSGFGIDCSGFSQRVYRICGISIPRNSSQQGRGGAEIAFGEHKAGDLALFSKPNKDNISHVGILCGRDKIIHASGRVREDTFDRKGIVHLETGEITHHLKTIRRW